MAVQATPYVETALSHGAELFRRNLQSGLPLGSAGGVVIATPTAAANGAAGTAGCSDLSVNHPASGMSVLINPGQIFVPGSSGSGSGYGIGTGYGFPAVTLNGGSAPTVATTAAATVVQLTTQGAYYCYNDNSGGQVSLTIAASNPSNPRIDVVVAQVEDAAYTGSNNDWKLAVVTGTAAASPTVPSLPASCVVLAYVWVPAAATNIIAGDILDLRVAYDRNPFRASAYRNGAFTGSASATIVFDTETYDLTNSYSVSTGLFTCPVGGLYAVDAELQVTANAVQLLGFATLYNGGISGYCQYLNPCISGTTYIFSATKTVLCNEGDTLGAQVHASGSWSGVTGITSTRMNVNLLSP